MSRLLRHRASDARGAAAVEFALLLPVLIMLVFGIVQFSLAYNRQQGLHAAAREGARLASLPTSSKTQVVARVNDALEGVSFPSPPTVGVTPDLTFPCQDRPGLTVVVTVTGATDLDVPLWNAELITLTGRGEFRCE